MLHIYPDFYHQFRCIASRCPDSCCAGWEVVVDDEAAAFYETVPGPLGESLREAMTVDDDGDRIFRMREGKCPFWNEDRLCRIELELGHEAPCATCRKFPRLTQDYGVFTEYGLTLACPEAARLILTHEGPWSVVTRGDPGHPCETDLDWDFLRQLADARRVLLDELWNEAIPEREALARCLIHGQWFQRLFDNEAPGAFDPDEALSAWRATASGDCRFLIRFLLEREILTERWHQLLEEAEADTEPLPELPETGMVRNLIADSLYRYWFQAVNDYDCLLRLGLLAVNWAVVRHLARVHLAKHGRITEDTLLGLFRLYAREVEHDDVNREALEDLLLTGDPVQALLPLI